jgi:hypothetical protein
MFNVLVDTCVWLDLAQDKKLTPLPFAARRTLHRRSVIAGRQRFE